MDLPKTSISNKKIEKEISSRSSALAQVELTKEYLLSLTIFLDDNEIILYKGREIYSKSPILDYSDLKNRSIIRID